VNAILNSESISPSQARATVHAFSSKRDSPVVNRDTPRLATTGLAAASAFRNGTADYLTSISNLALNFEEAFRAAQA
jgi:hypothetical protein